MSSSRTARNHTSTSTQLTLAARVLPATPAARCLPATPAARCLPATPAARCLPATPAAGRPAATATASPAGPSAGAAGRRRPGWLRILAPPAGRHRGLAARTPLAALMRGVLAAVAVGTLVLVLAPLAPAPVSASTTPRRVTALRWAERRAGRPYCWGGTGPSCFDCSGLVMKAYERAGINLPRTTTGMLGSSKLRRIAASDRRRGDLAFYGSGHVELVTNQGTFGALDAGTVIGWHHPNRWWHPTMYFRVR